MKHLSLLTLIALIAASCKKPGSGDNGGLITPEAATLLLPAKSSVCIDGKVASSLESTISFDWSDAANANSYLLIIKDLETGKTSEHLSEVSGADLKLARGKAFSWFVTSRTAAGKTSTSEAWKFYTAGTGVQFHVPFIPDLISPAANQNISSLLGSIVFKWQCSDADDDLVNYDLYLGKDASKLELLKGQISATELERPILQKGTYYWRVLARDAKGNTSISELNSFSVN